MHAAAAINPQSAGISFVSPPPGPAVAAIPATMMMPSLPYQHPYHHHYQQQQQEHRHAHRAFSQVPQLARPGDRSGNGNSNDGSSRDIFGTAAALTPSLQPAISPPAAGAAATAMAALTFKQKMAIGKKLLRLGTASNNVDEAESALLRACWLLENWALDLEEQGSGETTSNSNNNNSNSSSSNKNPFYILLAQAKHRLGQVCLLRGPARIETAARLFLQVLLHDPHTLSPTALAMTWYDVGLIYLRQPSTSMIEAAQSSFEYALGILRQQSGAFVDSTMISFVQQAHQYVVLLRQHYGNSSEMLLLRNSFIVSDIMTMPWSFQFTLTTYNCEPSRTANNNSTRQQQHQQQQQRQRQQQQSQQRGGGGALQFEEVVEETKRLLDPKIRHAGAA